MPTKHRYVDWQGRHSRSKNVSHFEQHAHHRWPTHPVYRSSTHPLFRYNVPKTWTLNTFPMVLKSHAWLRKPEMAYNEHRNF